nr:uncharacterized protein LOC128689755 [Cherax quadricarinatus]
MGTSLPKEGVHLEDFNHLKYTISLRRVGQQVLYQVFLWGYIGGSCTLKNTLFALPHYSQNKFSKDFNNSQRERITRDDSVSEFDITLIYKLLQLVCGLSDPSDSVWTTEASDSLEFCLHGIKKKRNELAHENIRLSPNELVDELNALRTLFTRTIQKAGQTYSIGKCEVNSVLVSVNRQLDAIRDSRVPLETEAEYQRELLASRKARLIEEAGSESSQIFNGICQVNVAPWLMEGRSVNVMKVFIHPKLKRDETQIMQRQLSVEESYLSVSDVLQARECDGTQPHVTLLCALGGMGKSTLLKYIIDRGINKTGDVELTDNFDQILFMECRRASFSSLDAMLAFLLPRTAALLQQSEFKRTLLSLNLLVILDDVDELNKTSFSVFEEFLKVMSPGTRVIATTSRETSKIIQRQISALHKRALVLEIEGIPDNQTITFIQRSLSYIFPSNTHHHESETELFQLIRTKRSCLQEHLRSPEILSLLALSWTFAPERLNASSTLTEIFMLVEDLLVHKVLQNLTGSSPCAISTQSIVRVNLRKFLISLTGVAAECLRAGKFYIDPEDLVNLAVECQTLKLPEEYLISAFMNYTDEGVNSLSTRGCKVSFPRRSTLQYYAAWSVTQKLQEALPSTTIRQVLGLPSSGTGEAHDPSLRSMMKYLVGMLALLLPCQLKTRAKEIVCLLKDLGVKKASQWLEYIEEAKAEATIKDEILKEMGDEWEVEDFAITSTLVDLSKETQPRHLSLVATRCPSNYPHLKKILKVCAASPELRLSLHLYQHFWSEKINLSDKFLDTVTSGDSPCVMEHFAGRLSSTAITRLPASLKRLAIHITPDMLETLKTTLPLLKALEMLYLNLDASTTTDPKTIPPLNISERPIALSVDIWKITKATVEWSCDIVKALSRTYTRLVLRGSELDADGCERWMEGLRHRGVTASWLVVGSTSHITHHQQTHLQRSAAKIRCEKFIWIKV